MCFDIHCVILALSFRLELIVEGNDDQPSDSNTLRTVVIHRGERGYGLTVSGESPVIVQDVKDGELRQWWG